MNMGPVFAIAAIFFAVERAWFIGIVCAAAAAFAFWRWRALR